MRIVGRHLSSLAGVKVAVLGLAFKPDTDDLRESPAFPILKLLKAAGSNVTAYDPVAKPENPAMLSGARLADSLEAAVRDADLVILVTRWGEFRRLPEVLRTLGRRPLVVDGRRMLAPQSVDRYAGVGL